MQYIAQTIQAFRARMPDVVETNLDGITCLATKDHQFTLRPSSGHTEVQCLDNNTGAELLIRMETDGSLMCYATASVRMNGTFEPCAGFQEAVDKFLGVQDAE